MSVLCVCACVCVCISFGGVWAHRPPRTGLGGVSLLSRFFRLCCPEIRRVTLGSGQCPAVFAPETEPPVGTRMPGATLCSRLHCHRDDPSLDDPIPQEFALFLCPTGPLLEELQAFWRESQRQCSRNRAHEVFPHITLCDFFTVSAPPGARGHLSGTV